MKKKIIACTVIFAFVLFSSIAYSKYGGISMTFYWDGWAGAKYCGTTKNLTIEEVHNDRLMDAIQNSTRYNLQSFSGKLSKRQSNLLWEALSQYDYVAGEIYAVGFREVSAPNHCFALTVQIKTDGGCMWYGFTYDDL